MAESSVDRMIRSKSRHELAEWLKGQANILQLIAEQRPLESVLEELVRLLEANAPGVMGSVMMMLPDKAHLGHCASVSLPRAFVAAIDGGEIGPRAGSCGTAAFLRKPIIVTDIATDPLWADWRDVALAAGLRACWSVPVISSGGDILGTFAMYHAQPATPSRDDRDLITAASDLARIAIERDTCEKHRRICEKEREALINRLMTALRTRDDFLSIVSHELRTPLTSLHLRFELLIERLQAETWQTTRDETLRDAIGAFKHLKRLERLVCHAMSVHEFDQGKLPLNLEYCDLFEIANSAAETLRNDFERKSCPLQLLGSSVWGRWDRTYLEQVVTILLVNALKYGAEKPVVVVVEESGGRARLSVRDSGIGIAAERLPQIFDRYDRGESSLGYGGLGLGLWIAFQIVRSLGGTIVAESEVEIGSLFVVELPLNPMAEPRVEPSPVAGVKGDEGCGCSS